MTVPASRADSDGWPSRFAPVRVLPSSAPSIVVASGSPHPSPQVEQVPFSRAFAFFPRAVALVRYFPRVFPFSGSRDDHLLHPITCLSTFTFSSSSTTPKKIFRVFFLSHFTKRPPPNALRGETVHAGWMHSRTKGARERFIYTSAGR